MPGTDKQDKPRTVGFIGHYFDHESAAYKLMNLINRSCDRAEILAALFVATEVDDLPVDLCALETVCIDIKDDLNKAYEMITDVCGTVEDWKTEEASETPSQDIPEAKE